MRIGVCIDGGSRLDELVAKVRQAQDEGFDAAWLPQTPGNGPRPRSGRRHRQQLFGYDALTALAVAAAHLDRLEIGTAVVPTYPRHPWVLAEQALTLRAAHTGPISLGIGVSHRHVVEDQWGYSYDRPLRQLREFLTILTSLLETGAAAYDGELLSAHGALSLPPQPGPPVQVMVAALGPRMLALAGELAAGTMTWMTGLRSLDGHVVPRITAAAERAGRPRPRVMVGLPVCVTADPGRARDRARRMFFIYGILENYRNALARNGSADVGDIAIVGDEQTVLAELRRYADAGVTDFSAVLLGEDEEISRTRALLAGSAVAPART